MQMREKFRYLCSLIWTTVSSFGKRSRNNELEKGRKSLVTRVTSRESCITFEKVLQAWDIHQLGPKCHYFDIDCVPLLLLRNGYFRDTNRIIRSCEQKIELFFQQSFPHQKNRFLLYVCVVVCLTALSCDLFLSLFCAREICRFQTEKGIWPLW